MVEGADDGGRMTTTSGPVGGGWLRWWSVGGGADKVSLAEDQKNCR